jgi:hypothetical protein
VLAALGAGAVAALVAAGPALADESPLPEAPPMVELPAPEPALETIPIPALPPLELAEPPVVVATVDESNVDVSVRVLSPEDEPAAAPESETSLVSGEGAPDITVPPEAEVVPADVTEPAGARNVNVSVRILSPGDGGEVSQDPAGGGEGVVEAGTRPSERSAEPRPASPTRGDSTEDSTQYHGDNSSEKFAQADAIDAWIWAWNLTIDCAGNAASSSTDTGDPASLVWSWSWGWTWGCTDAPPPDPAPEPLQAGSQPSPPSSSQSSPQPVETTTQSGDPWAWTWTFTFCGERTTISTSAGAGTPLSWTWDWSWTWFCPVTTPAETTPAPRSVDEQPRPVPDPAQFLPEPEPDVAPDLQLPSVWPASAPPELEVTTEIVLPPLDLTPLETPLETTIEIVIPAVVLPPVPATAPPLPVPELPFPSEAAAAGPTTTAARGAPAPPARTTAPRSPHWFAQPGAADYELPQAAPRSHQARPARPTRARGARPARPLPPLPFERPQPRQAAGGSSAGGFAPSALLLGVAALTGFIVLAAPGLGRRIRLARELSPRGLDESPLDRPG